MEAEFSQIQSHISKVHPLYVHSSCMLWPINAKSGGHTWWALVTNPEHVKSGMHHGWVGNSTASSANWRDIVFILEEKGLLESGDG